MSNFWKKLNIVPIAAIALLAIVTLLTSCTELISFAGVAEVGDIPSILSPSTAPLPTTVAAPPETTTTPLPSTEAPVTTAAPATTTAASEETTTAAPEPNPRNNIVICVDAGHGGKDPGAIGSIGSTLYYEKDINLSVALLLRDELEALGYQVVMTRDDDTYPENVSRRELAKKIGADMFVSIHSNSAVPEAWGTLVLFNSNGNYNYTKLTSLMCRAIADGVATKYDAHRDEVRTQERTDLIVLKALDIPSLMVELAFVSNSGDIQLLVDEQWQKDMARSIAAGVDAAYTNGLLD